MVDFEKRRAEKITSEVNLQPISFPPCCLSCRNSNNRKDYCNKLKIGLDEPFLICDEYTDA